jgi:polyisoprenoid-binding protein YceI
MIALFVAAAVAQGSYAVDPAVSTLRYVVTHKLHEVDATSKEVEGRAVVRPDGSAITEVRAQVASFRSGDGNRDEHMLEVMNPGSFPYVVFKGLTRAETGNVQMQGQVELHGVKKPYTVPLTVEAQPDGSLHVKGSFNVSLDGHGIDRPSLLFVKIEDACHIDVDLVLRGAK